MIQFGGQTPLKLARTLEAAGHRILGTPFDAIDLAEDRERFARLAEELGVRTPAWGIAASVTEASVIAREIGYPVLVRPSYVLGGRAMRVCHRADEVAAAFREAHGPALVDRFVANAIELDVDALCDGTETYVAAIMQHVEEAGVHSGDSSCVLPAPSLTAAIGARGRGRGAAARRRRSGSSGSSTSSSPSPRARSTCSRSTRAPRARCRSRRRRPGSTSSTPPAAWPPAPRLAELALPPERAPRQVSVKAAVLPFARFPGADPVLGPGDALDRGGDGDRPGLRRPRSRRRSAPPAGRCPRAGRRSSRCATRTRTRSCRSPPRSRGSGFGCSRRPAPRGRSSRPGSRSTRWRRTPGVVDAIRTGRCDLVVNTPNRSRQARTDGYRIREAALTARVPCITTLAGAAAAAHAIARARAAEPTLSLQERIDAETRAA